MSQHSLGVLLSKLVTYKEEEKPVDTDDQDKKKKSKKKVETPEPVERIVERVSWIQKLTLSDLKLSNQVEHVVRFLENSRNLIRLNLSYN